MELSGTAAWLTFSGAVIGGVLGVVGALIVAKSARRREDRTSAAYLQADLNTYAFTIWTLEEYCLEDDNTYADTCVEFYFESPRLSEDFGFHAARILHIDPIMPEVLQKINTIRHRADRELDMLNEGSGSRDPVRYRQAYESAFTFGLSIREWTRYALPVLELASRTGPRAMLKRITRRVHIWSGDHVSFVDLPNDVQEIREWEETSALFPGDEDWQDRLSEEIDDNCEEHWEDLRADNEPKQCSKSVSISVNPG